MHYYIIWYDKKGYALLYKIKKNNLSIKIRYLKYYITEYFIKNKYINI